MEFLAVAGWFSDTLCRQELGDAFLRVAGAPISLLETPQHLWLMPQPSMIAQLMPVTVA